MIGKTVAKRPYMNLDFQNNTNNSGVGGNTITPVGSPTYTTDQFGRSNGAINLNGSTQYLNTNFKTSDIDWTFTVVASVKRDSKNTMDSICGEIELTSNSYGIYFVYAPNDLVAGYFKSTSGNYDKVDATIDWDDEDWTNVAFVRDNGNYHRLLVNGVYYNQVSCANISNNASNNFRIGEDYEQTSRYFHGQFEYFRFYDVTLSDGQIKIINNEKGRIRS